MRGTEAWPTWKRFAYLAVLLLFLGLFLIPVRGWFTRRGLMNSTKPNCTAS